MHRLFILSVLAFGLNSLFQANRPIGDRKEEKTGSPISAIDEVSFRRLAFSFTTVFGIPKSMPCLNTTRFKKLLARMGFPSRAGRTIEPHRRQLWKEIYALACLAPLVRRIRRGGLYTHCRIAKLIPHVIAPAFQHEHYYYHVDIRYAHWRLRWAPAFLKST